MSIMRSRCVYLTCLILSVCLIYYTDGSGNYSEENDVIGFDTTTTAKNDNSSTVNVTESDDESQAVTQDPTSTTDKQTLPSNSPTRDEATTEDHSLFDYYENNGETNVEYSLSTTNSYVESTEHDHYPDTNGERNKERSGSHNQYDTRRLGSVNKNSKHSDAEELDAKESDDYDNDHSDTRRLDSDKTTGLPSAEGEKSSTTVLILASAIAVIISVGLSFCISYCVASTIAKTKGHHKSETMTYNEGEVPLNQITCTSGDNEPTKNVSKPCNEEEASVEVNQQETEQSASKDEGVVVVADNQTNDATETKVANEKTNEAAESVTGDKENNEVSEAAIKLFVEQCMSGATVNNAIVQAATASGVTGPQPTEEASVDATAISPSVEATNVNTAPIDQPIDKSSLNSAAEDYPQT